MHVLRTLGFEVQPISARVRVDRPRDFTPPRTHVFLRVELDGESWLVDAGVGGLSPTSALRLAYDVEQATPHEPRRLAREGGLVFHQAFFADRWNDVCEFTLEAMPEIDRVIANWYTSTHPASRFKERLLVARATPEGRLTLLNRTFTRREKDRVESHVLSSPSELLDVLAEAFGLHFASETRFVCPGLDWA
jgi:N-hydroxyarylamine O-acetyltransferase